MEPRQRVMPPTVSNGQSVVCMGVTLTLCALISHLPSGVPLTATQAAHELPFDFATRQPIVPVKVNGAPPCRSSWTPARRSTC